MSPSNKCPCLEIISNVHTSTSHEYIFTDLSNPWLHLYSLRTSLKPEVEGTKSLAKLLVNDPDPTLEEILLSPFDFVWLQELGTISVNSCHASARSCNETQG